MLSEPIAIVGIGLVFPGAQDVARFWDRVFAGIDSGRHVPPGRWAVPPEVLVQRGERHPDRAYSTWGCFIEDFLLDPEGLTLPVDLLPRLDPLCHHGLHAARAAYREGRLADCDPERINVVLGNIALPTETSSALARDVLGRTLAEQLAPGSLGGISRSGVAWENAHPLSWPAGLIATALGIRGGCWTLDAACAASLYALKFAVDDLRAGRVDAVLAGGLSRPDCQYTQVGFAQLQALSKSGRCAPLSAAADGLVVGEGAGIVALRRLSDALRLGLKIYGLLQSVGLSNDRSGNLLAPQTEGQLRAMQSAYRAAGWRPTDVSLIECHATGTPLGDSTELTSLWQLWQSDGATANSGQGSHAGDQRTAHSPRRAVVGAVKSNVGHLLTGAGSAGLIKVLGALERKQLPPTANFEKPSAALAKAGGVLRALRSVEPWESVGPRRAAINAFGFGGINAHVLVEEWVEGRVEGNWQTHPRDLVSQPVAAGSAVTTEPETVKPKMDEPEPIAIVGLDARVGGCVTNTQVAAGLLGLTVPPPAAPVRWWGGETTEWLRRELACDPRSLRVRRLESIQLGVGEFRIPPVEMQDMLPQQALLLQVTAGALAAAGLPTVLGSEAGAFVGISLDLNTTNFHLRWWLEVEVGRWNDELELGLGPDEQRVWVERLQNSLCGPLTANRTMGALGGIVASRVGREFEIGGPCFTLSNEEASGLRALQVACDQLRRREIEVAIVAAVDLACDPRLVIADLASAPHPLHAGPASADSHAAAPPVPADAAVTLIAMRAAEAAARGLPILALVDDVTAIGGPVLCRAPADGESATAGHTVTARDLTQRSPVRTAAAGDTIAKTSAHSVALTSPISHDLRDPTPVLCCVDEPLGWATDPLAAADVAVQQYNAAASGARAPFAISRASDRVGYGGAAAGLVSVLQAIAAIDSQVLPPGLWLGAESDARSGGVLQTQPWLRNREEGPRRAVVCSTSRDGTTLLARLRAPGDQTSPRRLRLPRPIVRSSSQRSTPIERASLERIAARLRDESRRTGDAPPRLAFVFPGSGNAFPDMGRELLLLCPEILDAQDAANSQLRSQYCPTANWVTSPLTVPASGTGGVNRDPVPVADTGHAKEMIFSQVALGTFLCDLLNRAGIEPAASIGYSLGESAALFGLKVWTERDEMLGRMQRSELFGGLLTPPYSAARAAWQLPLGQSVPWIAGVVDRGRAEVEAALIGLPRAYLLIVNTPRQCFVGGDEQQVAELIRRLSCTFVAIPGAATVHCSVLQVAADQYRVLHEMNCEPRPGITFYSSAAAAPYQPDRQGAAEAIVAQAVSTVDFPAVIERAYRDGVRLFLEIGPGQHCTRMIREILGDRAYWARSLVPRRSGGEVVLNPVAVLAETLAELEFLGVPINWTALTDRSATAEPTVESMATPATSRPVVTIPVGGDILVADPVKPPTRRERVFLNRTLPAYPVRRSPVVHTAIPAGIRQPDPRPSYPALSHREASKMTITTSQPADDRAAAERIPSSPTGNDHAAGWQELQQLTAETHEQFARLMQDYDEAMACLSGSSATRAATAVPVVPPTAVAPTATSPQPIAVPSAPVTEVAPWTLFEPPRALDRAQCMEFAIGAIGRVLGPQYAEVDRFPTRVRLPDEPLMLVDRIVRIEGEPLSLTTGRVVTEHDIDASRWYLDCGRIPTSVAVESGQADLFLAGYLGIDRVTRGLAVYRLLDAVVTFHDHLPGPGATIRYDIRIHRFFRQGETHLFKFEFEATIDGRPLLTMREGCAGFFTQAELAAGKGIVHTALDRAPQAGVLPKDWRPLVPLTAATYTDQQLDALRQGDLAGCFGPQFAHLPVQQPVTIPGGKLKLVDRVLSIDPQGGKYGLGLIKAEADIHSDDWFLTCHFCDDHVMPGTLMYECCLHTLRILLLRMGWVGEAGEVAYEPVPGVHSRLKCRGQVIESTQKVWYEITIRELGYRPEPYCLADALMYADGRPIVEIINMSVQLPGLTQSGLEALWQRAASAQPAANAQLAAAHPATTARPVVYDRRPALYDTNRITAFAIGKPSVAFGDRYLPFDEQRKIARLPGPPFQFLDRITEVTGPPWEMKAGAGCVAQYDVPIDAWYFAANRQPWMPFSVLLETALQPCGWLAAYVGSALNSPIDLSFRNLGGSARQLQRVTPEIGTLTTKVTLTRVSNSGGMIIQHFDFELSASNGPVYVGNTYFGFFSQAALSQQVGIRDARPYAPSAEELTRAQAFVLPDQPPFPTARYRMIDQLPVVIETGGPAGQGFLRGCVDVDPAAWFFQAHFYQDPVWPGSLGLESFFQVLKFAAVRRWGATDSTRFDTIIPVESPTGPVHSWVYRGQVIPRDQRVTVEAVISQVDDQRRTLTGDGFLSVDGRIIYQMKDFTLGWLE